MTQTFYDIIRYNEDGRTSDTIARFRNAAIADRVFTQCFEESLDADYRLVMRCYRDGEQNNAAFYEQTIAGVPAL